MPLAISGLVRIQDMADFGGVLGAGTDGYAITWNNGATQFDLTDLTTAPGGVNTNVQYNNAGAFGGVATFTYTNAASPNLFVQAANAAHIPQIIRLAVMQTANALEVQNSTTANVFSVGPTGTLTWGTDTNLYRTSADRLRTDDALDVYGTGGIHIANGRGIRNASETVSIELGIGNAIVYSATLAHYFRPNDGVTTLTGALADGYSGALRHLPAYTGAFAVTRHNYFDVLDATVAGGASVTNSALFRFDANIGTHKALPASFVTTDSNGDTTTWAGGIYVNVNGTLYKIPLIAA